MMYNKYIYIMIGIMMYRQKIPLVKAFWNAWELTMFSIGQENLSILHSVPYMVGRLLKKMY
jgi:hypothetical protein